MHCACLASTLPNDACPGPRPPRDPNPKSTADEVEPMFGPSPPTVCDIAPLKQINIRHATIAAKLD
jgi:hypothetical protein